MMVEVFYFNIRVKVKTLLVKLYTYQVLKLKVYLYKWSPWIYRPYDKTTHKPTNDSEHISALPIDSLVPFKICSGK